MPLPSTDQATLTQLALNLRPDLQARRAAILEAEAAARLVRANRFGNPSMGPYFAFDPTAITYVGARMSSPVGSAEHEKRRNSPGRDRIVPRPKRSAADRVASQPGCVRGPEPPGQRRPLGRSAYAQEVLPDLSQTKQSLENMFARGEGGVDLARYLQVQRAFLKATENFLDARYEVSQAEVRSGPGGGRTGPGSRAQLPEVGVSGRQGHLIAPTRNRRGGCSSLPAITPVAKSLYLCDGHLGFANQKTDLIGIFNAIRPSQYPHGSTEFVIFAQLTGGQGQIPFYFDIRNPADPTPAHSTTARLMYFPHRETRSAGLHRSRVHFSPGWHLSGRIIL